MTPFEIVIQLMKLVLEIFRGWQCEEREEQLARAIEKYIHWHD